MGTMSVWWCGIVARAPLRSCQQATTVTGCWPCGQLRVAVGSSGSGTAGVLLFHISGDRTFLVPRYWSTGAGTLCVLQKGDGRT
jgi:hypothetical protein